MCDEGGYGDEGYECPGGTSYPTPSPHERQQLREEQSAARARQFEVGVGLILIFLGLVVCYCIFHTIQWKRQQREAEEQAVTEVGMVAVVNPVFPLVGGGVAQTQARPLGLRYLRVTRDGAMH